ncbi:MAG: 23S rRNA (pseudouridine(1915)-N(3))-methyltransferase RlmH [Candidatus Thermoplasmatota archaeon]|nr:23S rRNA (pseudouridine(1915)-N(3))-methyltransferase RlmH [Candidatus Thermoplasmatota archaeon]MEC8384992.1 23S rRNA (pseudouridine(1915)-N(3))-methyltransferase RlmH [Candidatus Thermoplasmatota archaeon]
MARINVHLHGKARDGAYSTLIDTYSTRLEGRGVNLIRHSGKLSLDEYISKLQKEKGNLILLDENGPSISTEQFVKKWNLWRSGSNTVHLAIGPVDGWGGNIEIVHEKLGLGPMTMTYEMAAVVLLEQLYRSSEIERGSNYHRT